MHISISILSSIHHHLLQRIQICLCKPIFYIFMKDSEEHVGSRNETCQGISSSLHLSLQCSLDCKRIAGTLETAILDQLQFKSASPLLGSCSKNWTRNGSSNGCSPSSFTTPLSIYSRKKSGEFFTNFVKMECHG